MNSPLLQPTQDLANDVVQLADDADTLLAATVEMASGQLREARQRLTAMVDRGREIRDGVLNMALEGTKAADRAVHRNIYQTLAIGVGTGVVMGFLLANRNRFGCSCE